MAQFARPDSDIEDVGWNTVPTTPTTLWDKLDEAIADDADFIQTGNAPVDVDFEVGLTNVTDPVSSTDHVLRLRTSINTGTMVWDGTVEVKQGATVIATLTFQHTETTTVTARSLTLSAAQADAITDYTALSVRVNANRASGTSNRARVTWIEFEVPDAGAPPAEVPGPPVSAQIIS